MQTEGLPALPTKIDDVLWRKSITYLYNLVGRGNRLKPAAVTPTGSPFAYTNNDLFQEQIIVTGGTVSDISFSRDGGTTYYTVGSTSGMFWLNQGDMLRVTYTAAPTMTKVPR